MATFWKMVEKKIFPFILIHFRSLSFNYRSISVKQLWKKWSEELSQFEGQILNSSSKDIHQFSTNTQHQSGLVISKEKPAEKSCDEKSLGKISCHFWRANHKWHGHSLLKVDYKFSKKTICKVYKNPCLKKLGMYFSEMSNN